MIQRLIENTVPICYGAGEYGTYLEWVLTTLTTPGDFCPPFNDNGNSHQFESGHSISGTRESVNGYIKNGFENNYRQWIRYHPKTVDHESLGENLSYMLEHVKKILHIYPDPNSVLLTMNNIYTKVRDDYWGYIFNNCAPLEKIYANWPVDKSTSIQDIPIWVKREFFSYYVTEWWFQRREWFHPDKWHHPNCKVILLKDLLFDFKTTLLDIQHFCNVEFVRPIEDMIPSHNTMISLQKNLGQDQLCLQIIHAITQNINFDWSQKQLNFASESWIQWKLKTLGYGLRCHGLDLFPTNSVQLQELTYKL